MISTGSKSLLAILWMSLIFQYLIKIPIIIFFAYVYENRLSAFYRNLLLVNCLAQVFRLYLLLKHPESLYFSSESVFSFHIRYVSHQLFILIFQQGLFLFILSHIVYKIYKLPNANNLYKRKVFRWNILTIITALVTFSSIAAYYLQNWIAGKLLSLYFSISIELVFLLLFITFRHIPGHLMDFGAESRLLKRFDRSDGLALTDQNFYIPFFSKQYYLTKNASIEDFCGKNGIDRSEEFNELIIAEYQQSFMNLINQYRVAYFVELAKNPEYKNYTLETLALASGFNSRTHLYKPFRKFHGGTPSDLI